MGYDHAYMIKYAQFALQHTEDSFRIKVLDTMIHIVRSLDDKATTT